MSEDELNERLSAAREAIARGAADFRTIVDSYVYQYYVSWGIRGDNTPQFADYLGYLDSHALYPNFKAISYESYLKEALEGSIRPAYS